MKIGYVLLGMATGITMTEPSFAQGFISGAEEGVEVGGGVAGPVGAAVGGAFGAASGTVKGLLGIEERPHVQTYISARRPSTNFYVEDRRVQAVLVPDLLAPNVIPLGYVRPSYSHGDATERVLVVDPRTGRVVDVID